MHQMPTRKPVVVRSINAPDGVRCVDILAHPEGDFSFREYRRDAEDTGGWRSIDGGDSNHAGNDRWPNEAEALRRARNRVPWLSKALVELGG